jgi:UDP-4-amino-4,6-dideoxy-N-acetyl-beta-L-altrosamine transaminase
MIPYGKQNVTDDDINAVTSVLKSDFLTQGPVVPKFEDSISKYVGSSYAIATNSATSALHIACLSLGLTKGDILWTSPNSFVASSNCGLYCGATVDFVDIDLDTYNICLDALEEKLINCKEKNTLPKILVPVHLSGQSCDMKRIKSLSNEYGFKIIEDASHAIGGKYEGLPIGNCKYSDICIFSFHPVKIITTGEGGMATTNDKGLADKLELFRSHGITRNRDFMHKDLGPWYYEQLVLGFNYRMTDIQAALGYSQLSRIESIIKKRHEIAERYNEILRELPLILPYQTSSSYSSFHLYIIRLKLNKINKSYLEVFKSLKDKGIGVNLHYIPIHTHPFYKSLGFNSGDFPNSERFASEAISIPMYPNLTNQLQDEVVEALISSI